MIFETIKRLFAAPLSPSFYGRSDPGQVREHNEDSFCTLGNRGLFVVADGMGGHRAGEVASRLAIESLIDFFAEDRLNSLSGKNEAIRLALLEAFEQANRQVIDSAAKNPEHHGMGCTLVACLIDGRQLHTCHVGDARCYIAADGGLTQITTDHTAVHCVQQNSEEAGETPQCRSVVTRVIGFPFPAKPEYHVNRLTHGNRILLCSDGLWNMLDQTRIEHILLKAANAEEACEALVDAANEEGGRDNITALAIFC